MENYTLASLKRLKIYGVAVVICNVMTVANVYAAEICREAAEGKCVSFCYPTGQVESCYMDINPDNSGTANCTCVDSSVLTFSFTTYLDDKIP
jgi:hypothetical protein